MHSILLGIGIFIGRGMPVSAPPYVDRPAVVASPYYVTSPAVQVVAPAQIYTYGSVRLDTVVTGISPFAVPVVPAPAVMFPAFP